MTYEQFKEVNDKIKKTVKGTPFNLVLKIESVNFDRDTCVINGNSYKIKVIVDDIIKGLGCLSNPSILANWKGFKNQKTLKKSNKGSIEKILKENFSDYIYYGNVTDNIAVVKVNGSKVGLFDISTESFSCLYDMYTYDDRKACKIVVAQNKLYMHKTGGTIEIYTIKNLNEVTLKVKKLQAKRMDPCCELFIMLNDRFLLITGYYYTFIYDTKTDTLYLSEEDRYLGVLHADSSMSDLSAKVENLNIKEENNKVEIRVRLVLYYNNMYDSYIQHWKPKYSVIFKLYKDDRPLQIEFRDDKNSRIKPYAMTDYSKRIKVEKNKR